jgi:hypothetical protein
MEFSAKRFARRMAAVGISAALLLPVIGAAPVAACEAGCTPGYWKNHINMWPAPYTTKTTVGSVFDIPDALSSFRNVTLFDALEGGGGPGLNGATTILLRAAVASLLNSGLPDGLGMQLDFTLRDTNNQLSSLNRASMLQLAAEFDYWNNLYCPY